MDANKIIQLLDLKPLPEEGGFFKETYRAEGIIPKHALPEHAGERVYATSIYYLITPEQFSELHRVRSAEIFYFFIGDPVEMIQLDSKGKLTKFVLGSDIESGQSLQVVVPHGVWQGTKLVAQGKWALMGCNVAPGFEFEDFELANSEQLTSQFPQHKKIIESHIHDK